MTVDEFLDCLEDPNGALWQLVDGEPVPVAPASDMHGTIQANLSELLVARLRQARPGRRLVANPGIRPRVRPDRNARVPDLAVTRVPARPGTHLMPDPVLAVKILSASNEAKPGSNVWTYCTIPSLREILVVRSASVAAELLRRDADGSWPDRFAPFAQVLELTSIAASFPLAELYRGIEFEDA